MNKRQKLVQEAFLDNEEAVIKRLKQVYNQSLKDITAKTKELQDQINTLDALEGMTSDPDELAKLMSMKQSKVYQKQYQDALKKQVSSILDNMQVEEFKTVSEYLNKCYEEGFLGTMYDLHGQGIPLIMPMDQEAMVRAVQLDSKIKEGYYQRLGEDVSLLKKKITAQVSRGISTGMSFQQVAKGLADYTNIGFNNAVRIARTEGHRIQVQSGMDACYKAKEKGADVVKQWDSTLDGSTRESHQKVDGEIRELDEPFSNKLMFPGDPSGGAAEVINCRCALLQRARWALDDEELDTLKERAEYFGLDKAENFEEFKRIYLKLPKNADTMAVKTQRVPNAISESLDKAGVAYKQVMPHKQAMTEEQIIIALAGGDRTQGSCASVGLAYCGQKHGLDVLDFRDGESRNYFSTKHNLKEISKLSGLVTKTETARSSVTAGNKLLKQVEKNKEYYLVSGRHAAIVRRTDENILQYLELQSANKSGWTNFDGNPRHTLSWRFGEVKSMGSWDVDVDSFMIEVDSFKDCEEFQDILGYINTVETEQRKGKHGSIK